MTIVTAADAKFYRSLVQFLASLVRHRVDARHRVLVYDLGLTPQQRARLSRRFPGFELRTFRFDAYPAFVGRVRSLRDDPDHRFGSILGGYAWKPAIVHEVLEERRGIVLWLDSATVVHDDLGAIEREIEEHGTYAPQNGTARIGELTSPATLALMRAPLEVLDRRFRGGGICGFGFDVPVVRELVAEWKRWALVEECIHPEGATVANHRFDQSILAILLQRCHDEHGLRLTEDENEIGSRVPPRSLTVRNKVAGWVPEWLDPAARLWFGTYRVANRGLLRLDHFRRTRLAGLSSLARERWSIAVKRRGEANGRFVRLPAPWHSSHADPFVIEREGRAHVFFEELDHLANKGRIATVAIDGDLRAGEPVVAIEQPYHMSYPFVFEHGGGLFLIPSTSNRSIDLYECERFPDRWRLRKRLFHGIDAADSSLVRHDGAFWLFTSVRDGHDGHERRLCVFRADDLYAGWTPHPVNDERRGAAEPFGSGRGAGPFLELGGRLVRPVQHGTAFYGQSVRLRSIERLTATELVESPLATLAPPLGAWGTHHVSASASFVVMDLRERVPLWTRRAAPGVDGGVPDELRPVPRSS